MIIETIIRQTSLKNIANKKRKQLDKLEECLDCLVYNLKYLKGWAYIRNVGNNVLKID